MHVRDRRPAIWSGRLQWNYDLSLSAIVDGVPNATISALPDDLRHLILFDRSAIERNLGPVFVLDAAGAVVLEARPGTVGESNHWAATIFLCISRTKGPHFMSAGPGCPRQAATPSRSAAE